MKTQKTSIAHQKNFFEKYIKDKGWKLYKIYEDVESGMTVEKRVGLQGLISDSDKNLFEIVLTKSISRFARNTLEGLHYIREFKRKNIRFVTIEDAFDSKEYDEFMFTLLLSMAQKESEKISERVKFGKTERAKKGLYNGSHPPYGYKIDEAGFLKPAENITSEVVLLIFNMYIKGMGLYKISKHLNDKGYPTPSLAAGKSNSSSVWHQSTIKNIITNEVYIGNMVQNKSKTKDLFLGIREENHRDEYIEVKNTHQGIINEVVFSEANRILNERSHKRIGNKSSLFAGILYCGECESRLHYKKNKRAYLCGKVNKMGKKYCDGCYIREDNLKKIVKKNIDSHINNTIKVNELEKIVMNQFLNNQRNISISDIISVLDNTKEKRNRLLNIYLEGLIDKQEYKKKSNSIESQIKLLQNRKKDIELNMSENADETLYRIRRILNNLILDKLTLDKIINKIIIYRNGNIHIHYNFVDANNFRGCKEESMVNI